MQISIAAKPAQSEKDDKKIEKNVIDRPKKLIKFSQVVVKKNISPIGQCSFIFFVPVFTDNCNIDFVRVFKKIVGVEAESFVIEPVAAHFNVDILYIQRGFHGSKFLSIYPWSCTDQFFHKRNIFNCTFRGKD
jgi:hypothetical protein